MNARFIKILTADKETIIIRVDDIKEILKVDRRHQTWYEITKMDGKLIMTMPDNVGNMKVIRSLTSDTQKVELSGGVDVHNSGYTFMI